MQQGYTPSPGASRVRQAPPRKQSRRRRRGHKSALLIAILLVLCALCAGAYYASVTAAVRPYESVFLDNISIDGISLSGMTAQQGVDAVHNAVAARQAGWSADITYNGHTYVTISYETLGMTTDMSEVNRLLNQAWSFGHEGTIFDQKSDIEALKETPFAAYTAQASATSGVLDGYLSTIKQNIDRAPTDAKLLSFDPDAEEPFAYQNETWGLNLNTETVRAQILDMAARGESGAFELSPDSISPSVFVDSLRGQTTLLATGITPIAKNSSENRNANIDLAFKAINGLVLKDGESFSFNKVVGMRTAKNGYLTAPEYAYGELVTGYGGGVCQASTTVYLAAVCANLDILKRSPHSDPVNYTEKGQDATVYYTRDRQIDFSFKNESGATIYLTAHLEKDPASPKRLRCVVRVYGQSLGDNIHYRLDSVITSTIPAPAEKEIVKDTEGKYVVYTDQEYKVISAKDGYVVDTYLQKVQDGSVVSQTLISTDTYQARAARYYVGVKSR